MFKHKWFHKLACLLLAAALLAVALAGCSGKEESGGTFKVGFVCSASGQNDNGYNKSAVDAIKAAHNELGFEYRIIEPAGSIGQAIETLAQDGFDLIFNLEYDFDALVRGVGGDKPLAEQYPNTTFVIYNDNPNVDENGNTKFKNVYAVMFNVNEASYLAGYLAVHVNENHEKLFPVGYKLAPLSQHRGIGFIGGTDSAGIRVYSYGYMMGIQAAAEEYGVEYDYYARYDAGFSDTALGNQMTQAMYNSGANIVFADCGNVGDGITARAKEDGRLAIQTDADLDHTHPGHVITSVLKTTGVPTDAIIRAFAEGRLKDMDNLLNYDIKSGATGITDMSVISGHVADKDLFDDIKSKVNIQADKIKSGEIRVVNAQIGEPFDPGTCPRVRTR